MRPTMKPYLYGFGFGVLLAIFDLYEAQKVARIRAEYRAELYSELLIGVMDESAKPPPLFPDLFGKMAPREHKVFLHDTDGEKSGEEPCNCGLYHDHAE